MAVQDEMQKMDKVQQEMRNLADELSQERKEMNKKNHDTQTRVEKLEAELREAKVEIEQSQKVGGEVDCRMQAGLKRIQLRREVGSRSYKFSQTRTRQHGVWRSSSWCKSGRARNGK